MFRLLSHPKGVDLRRRGVLNERGYTLIELLLVVIVLGLLAAIVVFSVGQARGDATEATCRTAVSSIELSAEAYHTRIGHYRDTQTDVQSPDAMLKDWPTSDHYLLTYVPTGYLAGPPVVHASGFTVTVQNADGVAVAGCGAL